MPGFANSLQHGAISAEAVSIAALVLTWLEQRIEVVEYQQAGPLAEELEKHIEPRRFALGRHQLLV